MADPFIFEVEPFTARQERYAALASERVGALEATLAALVEDGADDDRLAEADLVRAELATMRTAAASTGARPGFPKPMPGYWIVPYQPSHRALARANGLTDLVDASASPARLESTVREIELAVKLFIEIDGVPCAGSREAEGVEEGLAERESSGRKEALERLSNIQLEFVPALAKLSLVAEAFGELDETSLAVLPANLTRALERACRPDSVRTVAESLSGSVAAWADLLRKY